MEAVNDLVMTCGRTLLKFTEGCEDWQEWIDVRDVLEALADACHILEPDTVDYARKMVADFDKRMEARFPGFNGKRQRYYDNPTKEKGG